MTQIYHITTRGEWQQGQSAGKYTSPSLNQEGFIHCSTAAQVVQVANAFYRTVPELVLLCIEPEQLVAELKWEAPAHPEGHEPPPDAENALFPHIYGNINLDAVITVLDLVPDENGFSLPDGI